MFKNFQNSNSTSSSSTRKIDSTEHNNQRRQFCDNNPVLSRNELSTTTTTPNNLTNSSVESFRHFFTDNSEREGSNNILNSSCNGYNNELITTITTSIGSGSNSGGGGGRATASPIQDNLSKSPNNSERTQKHPCSTTVVPGPGSNHHPTCSPNQSQFTKVPGGIIPTLSVTSPISLHEELINFYTCSTLDPNLPIITPAGPDFTNQGTGGVLSDNHYTNYTSPVGIVAPNYSTSPIPFNPIPSTNLEKFHNRQYRQSNNYSHSHSHTPHHTHKSEYFHHYQHQDSSSSSSSLTPLQSKSKSSSSSRNYNSSSIDHQNRKFFNIHSKTMDVKLSRNSNNSTTDGNRHSHTRTTRNNTGFLFQQHEEQQLGNSSLKVGSSGGGGGGGTSGSSSNRHHRKRKSPVSSLGSDLENFDDSITCTSTLRTLTPTDDATSKKQNHSEIEKRRRDKMNTYITELSGMVPMCSAMSRKLDKLTVLRMAVQHMKTLRGSQVHSYTEGHYKPSFLTDTELKHLILQSAEGFLFVVGCDRGRLLYVSESVEQVLNYSQSDLLGQSWFDILHPKDVSKVKEQLSASDLSPRERLIDAKTMLPVKGGNVPQRVNRLCPGARRSFFCRMKCKPGSGGGGSSNSVKQEESCSESGTSTDSYRSRSSLKRTHSTQDCVPNFPNKIKDRKFCVIHCTGYMKAWTKPGLGLEDSESDTDCESSTLSCLVAIGRILPAISTTEPSHKNRPVTFMSRHTVDGKFVFVDQRATLVVGFLPQELLGISMYSYYHEDDIPRLAQIHKNVLNTNETLSTGVYRFRTWDSLYAKMQSNWKAFRNPWTKDIEYLIASNTLILYDSIEIESETTNQEIELGYDAGSGNFSEFFSNEANTITMDEMNENNLLSRQVEGSKIGEKIAHEMKDTEGHGTGTDSSSTGSPKEETGTTSPGDRKENSLLSVQQQIQSSSSKSPDTRHNGSTTSATTNTMINYSNSMDSSVILLSASGSTSLMPPTPSVSFSKSISEPSSTIVLTNLLPAQHVNSRTNPQEYLYPNSSTLVESTGGNGPDPCLGGPRNTNYILANEPSDGRTLNTLLSDTEKDEMLSMMEDSGVLPESPHHGGTSDGNDEAAMAVIMSLLEADAGLGGPVDFSGLPWPLP